MYQNEVRSQKEALRKELKSRRNALSKAQFSAKSQEICQRLLQHDVIREAHTVQFYWPIVERNEVDVRPAAEHLHESGTRILLPVVDFSEDAAPTMHPHLFEGRDALHPNKWGIPEPSESSAVDPDEIDAVVVPAFGAGRNGHRIGHGFGFYDRFLSQVEGASLCVIFQTCLVDTIPHEPHDIPLDWILTEDESIYPAS